MPWQVGDTLINRDGVRRMIVAVRPHGYTWTYPAFWPVPPDDSYRTWLSENSTDPLLICGWTRQPGAALAAEEHRQRHQALHRALDELLADFVAHGDPLSGMLSRPIADLLQWSHAQTQTPTPLPDCIHVRSTSQEPQLAAP